MITEVLRVYSPQNFREKPLDDLGRYIHYGRARTAASENRMASDVNRSPSGHQLRTGEVTPGTLGSVLCEYIHAYIAVGGVIPTLVDPEDHAVVAGVRGPLVWRFTGRAGTLVKHNRIGVT